ncbi:MAG: VacJ family lipoprotein [Smithellaceae bacterium]|jgi:phospholipid-binding lipoprotein MlaA
MSSAICRVCSVVVALYLVLSLSGCATTTTAKFTSEVPAMHSVSEFSDDERVVDIADPWERFNLNMYNFNYHFDRYFFLPVVSGYEFITPTLIQKGVTNFFSNIGEVRTFYNSLFQLKGKKALITFGRFVTNSTIGIGGLFDPATSFGLEAQSEDFGQTLGYWGVDSGPYLVVPVLGPNTLRSTGGFAVDAGIRYAIVGTIDPFENVENGNVILIGISTMEAIDMRHKQKFRYYESGYPFEYYMVRFLYNKKSELLLMK